MWRHPVYPSARATVKEECFTEAVEALDGVPLVFVDGLSILLPESEPHAIEILFSRFDAEVRYGCGKEWEFATKARLAGVKEELVSLGSSVREITGRSVTEMIATALNDPQATYLKWSALYDASMRSN